MTDALLASNHALEEELKRNDVESYAELPSEAKSRYRNCYNRAQKLYRRLYRVKLTETKAQVGSAKIREEEDGDDDDDDDADEKGGHEGFAAEASVNGAVAEMETPLDRIDDFPDAEHACGDAIRAAEVSGICGHRSRARKLIHDVAVSGKHRPRESFDSCQTYE